MLRQPGSGDVRQPAEDRLARHAAGSAVGLEVRVGEISAMQLQQQPGAADVRGGIAAGRIWSVDHDRLRGYAQDVQGVEIAVAQAAPSGIAARRRSRRRLHGSSSNCVLAMSCASRASRLPKRGTAWP